MRPPARALAGDIQGSAFLFGGYFGAKFRLTEKFALMPESNGYTSDNGGFFFQAGLGFLFLL